MWDMYARCVLRPLEQLNVGGEPISKSEDGSSDEHNQESPDNPKVRLTPLGAWAAAEDTLYIKEGAERIPDGGYQEEREELHG